MLTRRTTTVALLPKFTREQEINLLREYGDSFAFVEVQAFVKALELLATMIKETPSQELALFAFVIIVGAMGVGKTRTGRELAARCASLTPNSMAVGLRMSAIEAKLKDAGIVVTSADDANDPDKILAAALFLAFFLDKRLPLNLALYDVKERLVEDLGVTLVALNLDEYQDAYLIPRKIMKACQLTLIPGSRVRVVPIITGMRPARPLRETFPQLLPSQCRLADFALDLFKLGAITEQAPLGERTEFEYVFCTRLGMTWEEYAPLRALRAFFRDCGGHGRTSEFLAKRLLELRQCVRLDDGRKRLPPEAVDADLAEAIVPRLRERVALEFNAQRWHELLSPKADKITPAEKRKSWELSSLRLLYRLLLAVLTGRNVHVYKQVLEGVELAPDAHKCAWTFADCAATGNVGFQASADDWSVGTMTMPLVMALGLNELTLSRAIPLKCDDALNPFAASAVSHEELPMASLYLRLQAACEFGDRGVALQDLRPGALARGNLAVKVLDPTPEPTFSRLKVHVLKLDGKELVLWRVCVTAEREEAIDGIALFEGMLLSSGARCIVVWLSQSKFFETVVPEHGGPSKSKVHNSDVAKYLSGMRAVADDVEATIIPGLQVGEEKMPVHFVYEIFTDRLDQKSPLKVGTLADNETLLVTTASTFASVVGSTLAARQFRV